jgi:hypothetical protein
MNILRRMCNCLGVFLLVTTLLVAGRQDTYACTCMGGHSLSDAVRTTDVLFTGTLLARHEYGRVVCYTIAVSRDFKKTAPGDTIYICSGYGNGDCGFMFEPDKEYIIYASVSRYLEEYLANERTERTGREYWTDICTRTREKDDEEIAAIEKEL